LIGLALVAKHPARIRGLHRRKEAVKAIFRVVTAGMMLFATICAHAKDDASIPHTPQGISCPRGIFEITARSNDDFVLPSGEVDRRGLAKAVRAARHEKDFGCVVITGGSPDSAALMSLIKEFSRFNIDHVEWTGQRPVAKP